MEVAFDDPELDDLETNARAKPKLPTGVIKAFRKRLWQIRATHDERDFRENKGLHFERYQKLDGHYSIRLNDQYRLIIRFEQHSDKRTVVIVAVVDYH